MISSRVHASTLLLLLTLAPASEASAHTRGRESLHVAIHARGATLRLEARRIDVTALGEVGAWVGRPSAPPSEGFAARLSDRHRIFDEAGEPCPREGAPTALSARPESLRIEWSVTCANGGPTTLRSRPLPAPSHILVVTQRRGEGAVEQRVVTEPLAEIDLVSPDRPPRRAFVAFLAQGATHVLSGWDHVAFVLLLLFLARSLREVVFLVTGFTLGHTLTLVLATVGALEASLPAAEQLIAFSVLVTAGENAASGDTSDRWLAPSAVIIVGLGVAIASASAALFGGTIFAISYFALVRREEQASASTRTLLSALFGLMHGLGFASALDLAGSSLPIALLGFNVGVELGQLAVVVPAYALLRSLRERELELPLRRGLAALAASLATYTLIAGS